MLKSEERLRWPMKGNVRIKGLCKNEQIAISGGKNRLEM